MTNREIRKIWSQGIKFVGRGIGNDKQWQVQCYDCKCYKQTVARSKVWAKKYFKWEELIFFDIKRTVLVCKDCHSKLEYCKTFFFRKEIVW